MASIKLISVADSLYTGLLLKSLNKQRLLGLFCDVSFIIQDRMFKAHKNILSVASSFFHQLFKETGPVIELNFIKPDVFEAILDYIYLSKIIRVRSDLLGDLIKCGQILKIKFIANLGLILSQVKGIPGISKDFSPQDEAATFEMREPIKYFITHESSTDVIPVIIEEYSMTLHGLDWPEDFDYDDYDSLSFYPKVYSKSEKQPTSAKDYIKGTCRGTISAKGITEGSPALALTEIDLTASALASGVVDLSALASAGLAALTSTAGDLPALSLKECISTVPILKAAEMSHDLLSEAKTHSDVRSEFGVSPDVLSAFAMSPDELSALGISPDELSAFGISPDELSAFGISPDVLSAFGKSSDALSAFGKSSDALSPFGKSSDALSPFGKSSDALSAFGVSPDVLSELALERVGELPVVDLEDSEHLRTPSPMVETLEELEREFIKPEEEISIPSTLITDVKEVSTWPPSGVLTSGFPGVMDEEYMDLFNRQPTPFAQIAIGSAQSYLLDLHQRTKEATDYDVQNIEWASSKNFTVDLGMNQIEQYISTWEMQASWLHSIDFLQEETLEFSRRYHYRVKWSVPTRRKPVPRSTACVYFVIEVFTNKPENWPVQVYYFVESNRLLHRPGQSRFREKWLEDVIESKILLTEKITF